MIKVRIKEKAEEKGIKNAHRLEIAASLSPAAAARLWKGEIEKISMETLDRLCKALECQPGDLFVYTVDETKKEANDRQKSVVAPATKTGESAPEGNTVTVAKSRPIKRIAGSRTK